MKNEFNLSGTIFKEAGLRDKYVKVYSINWKEDRAIFYGVLYDSYYRISLSFFLQKPLHLVPKYDHGYIILEWLYKPSLHNMLCKKIELYKMTSQIIVQPTISNPVNVFNILYISNWVSYKDWSLMTEIHIRSTGVQIFLWFLLRQEMLLLKLHGTEWQEYLLLGTNAW